MLLNRFLENSAEKYPDKCALVCKEGRYTYREINREADRLACVLRNAGVSRGDRVAVFLENRLESIVSLYGIMKADAVFLMLSSSMKSEKLSYVLGHCGVKAIVTDSGRLQSNLGILRESRSLDWVICADPLPESAAGGLFTGSRPRLIPWEEVRQTAPESSPALPNRNIDLDLASVIYTSGSTANPKGVMLSHLNMISAARSITTYLENRQDDIILNVLPLSFDYGLYQVLMGFMVGGTVVLERSFSYPYAVLQRIRQEQVTGFPGVPTIFSILLQMDGFNGRELPTLRYITNTAAALPVRHVGQLLERFPEARIYSMYGLTECKRVSYLPPAELAKHPGSVGRGMPNEEVWIVDEKGGRVGPGVTGELVVRGSNVMRGYWGDPESTDAVLKPGPLPGERVLMTGDLFRTDEDGFLYFVGRKDDLIKTRGERVSPKEIENALYSMEDVLEAAVIPVPDEILGNAIKAYVVPKTGRTLRERDVIQYCRRTLEDYAVPRMIEFRDVLPKNASGKIDKLQLKGTPA